MTPPLLWVSSDFGEENKQKVKLMELEIHLRSAEVSKTICRQWHNLNTAFPVLNLDYVRSLPKALRRVNAMGYWISRYTRLYIHITPDIQKIHFCTCRWHSKSLQWTPSWTWNGLVRYGIPMRRNYSWEVKLQLYIFGKRTWDLEPLRIFWT